MAHSVGIADGLRLTPDTLEFDHLTAPAGTAVMLAVPAAQSRDYPASGHPILESNFFPFVQKGVADDTTSAVSG